MANYSRPRFTPEQREYATTIRGSGDALLTVINDILDFSKIESGSLELETQPFSLTECVESAIDLVAAPASEKGLELTSFVERHTPVAINGDLTRVRQVLVNLLSNAVKCTAQGEVVVEVSSRPLDGDRHELHFIVRDTGIGIPWDRMDRLFRSFNQVDASTTRHFGGTGLGLPICKRLCELMGGTIWAESEAGVGSRFHFTVRAAAAAAVSSASFARDARALFAGRHVLIVDDNATTRFMLSRQLQSWDMTVQACASGADALERLQRGERYDLAILDRCMPAMDGATLAARMRTLPQTRPLPLVLLSSAGNSARRAVDATGAGLFAASLAKPVKSAQLIDTLAAVVGGGAVTGRAADDAPLLDPALTDRLPLRILLADDNVVNQGSGCGSCRKWAIGPISPPPASRRSTSDRMTSS